MKSDPKNKAADAAPDKSSSARAAPDARTASPTANHDYGDKPLTDAERNEMQQLMSAFGADPQIPGQPPPQGRSKENYERMKELHARARHAADNWHEDGEAVDRESLNSLDLVITALRTIVATVPAAAAANQTIALLDASQARMKAAMTPPPPAPDLPEWSEAEPEKLAAPTE